MLETVIGHSFPEDTTHTGKLNNQIINSCIAQLEQTIPDDSVAIALDNTWLYFNTFNKDDKSPSEKLQDLYNKYDEIDYLIVFNFVDPLARMWPESKKVKKTIVIGPGTDPRDINFNFWAINCSYVLSKYKDQEVLLAKQNLNTYLCYQFKPHLHRQKIAWIFKKRDLLDKGIMTLGKFRGVNYNFPGVEQLYLPDPDAEKNPPGEADTPGVDGIIDPFRLGNLDIWRHSFLNIVSETSWDSLRPFVSEKTYKCMTGLRPFLINGHKGCYQWLDHNGFDVFEDLWCGHDLRAEPSMTLRIEMIADIVQHYSTYSDQQIYDLYQSLLPRLQANKDRLYEHAKQEEQRVSTLIPDAFKEK